MSSCIASSPLPLYKALQKLMFDIRFSDLISGMIKLSELQWKVKRTEEALSASRNRGSKDLATEQNLLAEIVRERDVHEGICRLLHDQLKNAAYEYAALNLPVESFDVDLENGFVTIVYRSESAEHGTGGILCLMSYHEWSIPLAA